MPIFNSPVIDAYPKADVLKRGIAFLIDAVLAYAVSLVLPAAGGILGAFYMLFRDALPIAALGRRSIGKNVMHLRVIRVDYPADALDLSLSAMRNWMFALGPVVAICFWVPILGWLAGILLSVASVVLLVHEAMKVFFDVKGIRMGDRMAGTLVIEGE